MMVVVVMEYLDGCSVDDEDAIIAERLQSEEIIRKEHEQIISELKDEVRGRSTNGEVVAAQWAERDTEAILPLCCLTFLR